MAVRSAFYNPYFIDESKNRDSKGNPQLPLFLTDNFIKDIGKVQTIKLFKVALSSYLQVSGSSKSTDLDTNEPNIYYAGYRNVQDVINGRARVAIPEKGTVPARYRHDLPFDGNSLDWRDTIIDDDVILCHYYNPDIIPRSRKSNITEVLYFFYDIVKPKKNGDDLAYEEIIAESDNYPDLDPKPFYVPVYENVEINKLAAIARTRGVDDQLYNYSHNWYYFNLKGYEVRCRFKVPTSRETYSGITDNTGNSSFSIFHRHQADAVSVPGVTEVTVTNTRPPNMRDAHDRLIYEMSSRCEYQFPREDLSSPTGTGKSLYRIVKEKGLKETETETRVRFDGTEIKYYYYDMVLPSGEAVRLAASSDGTDLEVQQLKKGPDANAKNLNNIRNIELYSEDYILDKEGPQQ